jgi:hypothetical protein
VTMDGGVGYCFYSGDGVCFRWWRDFWWGCPQGCFFRVFISGAPPIYGALCLYAQFHQSLFVLSRDLVV